jgi:pyruvate/2-oxoacid:ferredoxin oxidoreductase beta subunit
MGDVFGFPEQEFFCRGHTACAGCGEAICMRHMLKAVDKDTILVSATGCSEVVSTQFPFTAWKLPYLHAAFETAASAASGVYRALKIQGKKTKVFAFGGDGATFDIGFGALSGAAERGEDFVYVCLDNEAYMNCLSLDTFVMTENGLKRVIDIKLGEKVYAFNQKKHELVLKKCSGIFDNGIKKTYEVKTLHHSIKATSNHPFLTLKRKGKGKEGNFVWKTLEKLRKNDEIVVIKKIKEGKSKKFKPITLSKKGDYKVNKINKVCIPDKSSPKLMELLGLYVGDGWTRAAKAETGFALPEGTKARARLIKLCKDIFKTKLSKDKNYVYIYSVNLANFIDSLEFGKGAKNKIIPPWIFTLSEIEREAFVKGLMLSDGYKINNSHRYVSASLDLLKTLRLLLQLTGYRVGKIHCQTKSKGTNVVYRKLLEDSKYGYICFSKKTKPDISKYLSQTKQRDFLVDNDFFSTEKITEIKFVKEEPTIDLRVQGEHNFVADGIVVHNTGIQRSGATPKFAATTTSPAGKAVHGKTEWKKPLPIILAAHGCYVATANIAYLKDLIDKVKKAVEFKGLGYVQCYTPCVPGWKTDPAMTVEISKLAFNTCIYPLYEIENGVIKINKEPAEKKPIKEYLKLQGRFKHLTEEEINIIQQNVDYNWEKLKKLAESKIQL